MNILYIEDDSIDQLTFERIIGKLENIAFTICSNLIEVNQAIEKQHFDIIFADYYIGNENIKDILEIIKPTPFVVLSGMQEIKETEMLQQEGMLLSIEKPLTLEKVSSVFKMIKDKVPEQPSNQYLMDLSGGDVNFERELLQIAVEELPINIEQIKNAYLANNSKETIELLHKVKTKVTLAHMIELSDKITFIENEGSFSKQEITFILGQLESILNYFKSLLKKP